jgi:hypothetical protein
MIKIAEYIGCDVSPEEETTVEEMYAKPANQHSDRLPILHLFE